MVFQADDDAELGYEDALCLLDELHDAVDELEEEGEDAHPEQMERARELLEQLLASFDELPVTSALVAEHLETLEGWSRALLSEDQESAGPGSIHQLLRDELGELRGFLEYELAT